MKKLKSINLWFKTSIISFIIILVLNVVAYFTVLEPVRSAMAENNEEKLFLATASMSPLVILNQYISLVLVGVFLISILGGIFHEYRKKR